MFVCVCIFFVKLKTAYELRISDWSSDVCSSDLCCRWVIMSMAGMNMSTAGVWPNSTSGTGASGCHAGMARPAAFNFSNSASYSAKRADWRDRKGVVEGKSVSVRVCPGGRRNINKQQQKQQHQTESNYKLN